MSQNLEKKIWDTGEFSKILFDATPIACNLWNRNFQSILCNKVALEWHGAANIEEFCKHFVDYSPEYQPDGKRSREMTHQWLLRAFESGYERFEWMYQTTDGKPLPCEITLVRIEYEGEYHIAAYQRDLREQIAMTAEADEANERIKLMLDSNPLVCVLRDDQGDIIDCNQEALKLFGIPDKDEFCKNFFSYFPEFQSDGSRTADNEVTIRQALETEETITFNHDYLTPTGKLIPSETKIVKIPWKNTNYFLAYSRDLREQKKMMAEIEQHGYLLNKSNEMSALLLQSNVDTFEKNLQLAMSVVGEAIGIDQMYVWKNHRKNGKLYCTQILEWTSKTEPRQLTDAVIEISYADTVPTWEEKLSKGNCINSIVSDLSPLEQASLVPQGILSILVVPIFLHNQFWGFVGLNNCTSKQVFSENVELIMRSASLSLINAINQNEQHQTLKEVNDRAKAIMEASPIGMTLWDNNGNLFDCNEAYVRLLGIKDTNEFLERHYELNPEYQPDGWLSSNKITTMIKQTFSEGRSSFEWTHLTSDGTPVPCNVVMVRVAYGNGFAIAGYLRDLRQHKAMMEAIEYQSTLLNMANQVAAILLQTEIGNFDEEIVFCMEMIGKAVNADRSNIWKNSVKDGRLYCTQIYEWLDGAESQINKEITIEMSYDEVIPGWKEILSHGDCINNFVKDMSAAEQEQLSAQGIKSLCVVPIFVRGEFWGFMGHDYCREGHLLDQTALSILRSCGLMVANTLLQHELVKNMLASMERERDLEIEKQTAQAASEAKMQFLANMSHEIRTPMNAVLGMSELLLQENLNEQQFRYASDIKMSASALLDIINDILDVSKLQAGKLKLVPTHYDFYLMIDNVRSLIQFLIKDKDITLEFDLMDHAPTILYGDDKRLRQVLLNLLGNAIKFTERGYVKLIVRFTETTLKITVNDTGSGIPVEGISSLFDAFEQTDTINHRDTKGTGLGLTITKSIVELMGGQITVESVYGQGSSFYVEIPKVLGDAAMINTTAPEETAIYAPDARVLVVDDNTTNLNVACGLLRLFGINAETVVSGQQAIERVSQKQYDVVFMDYRMPEMNGIAATRVIREMGIDVPIIALTASAIEGQKETMLSAGMDDYLSKPIMKADLIRTLKKWIPTEKLMEPLAEKIVPSETDSETDSEEYRVFWNTIGQISGLDLSIGLESVDGQRDVYRQTLHLMVKEIEKSQKNLNGFLMSADAANFCIEVHGIKGALANIGARTLSAQAYELELAAKKNDLEFCSLNLPALLKGLAYLYGQLTEAFSANNPPTAVEKLPAALPPILTRLKEAYAEVDMEKISQEIEHLNAFHAGGTLKAAIEQIASTVMMMDYDETTKIINELLQRESENGVRS